MGKKLFTDEQELYIRNNYSLLSPDELARKVGVSKRSLISWANRNGIHRKFLCLTDNQKSYIRDNYLTMQYSEIGNAIGLTAKQVEGWIRNHIDGRESKIRKFNDRYFDSIDTPEKAYWLGFIFADGYVVYNHNGNSYEFGMELQKQDRYILEALNARLGSEHNIYDNHKEYLITGNKRPTSTDVCRLRVYSKRIVKSLEKNGVVRNKTLQDKVPHVEDELFRDFLRGYIDGDGCIHIMSKEKHILGVHITCASRAVLEYINSKVYELYGISGRIYSEGERKHRLYWFRKKDVKTLLGIIYYDNSIIKLERKYNIYKSFYGLAA